MNAFLQWLVIALLLGWSLFTVLRRVFATPLRHAQERLAAQAGAHGWPRLARWLQPAASAGGCGSGCSTCGDCASAPATPAEQPVTLKPSSRH